MNLKTIFSLVSQARIFQRNGLRSVFQSVPWISDYYYREITTEDDGSDPDASHEDIKLYISAAQRRVDYARSRRKGIAICVSSFLGLAFTIAVVTIGLVVHARATRQSDTIVEKTCGSSPTEARSRGCRFEPQLSSWMPPACFFSELVAEFEADNGDMMAEWPWWFDINMTAKVTEADVPDLQAGNYASIYTDYFHAHEFHCLYCWRKVSHALEKGFTMMDTRCHQFFHNRHCAQFIVDRLMQRSPAKKEKWSYPLMYHECVELASTVES
ncbi:hypothetical protein F4820DRAFT_390340 [Hypoxylon rubiginosum]|uniref:Uncharacterized protein n=1 Tax=Hypoxylon rubiginosum TaxID=110542 RepID=A0ACB9YUD1_9PEZI|nr:hypothetical protein F4820DRAFT_390340 [Hypoxylon rubiginosum]